jgi:hypothetical protein
MTPICSDANSPPPGQALHFIGLFITFVGLDHPTPPLLSPLPIWLSTSFFFALALTSVISGLCSRCRGVPRRSRPQDCQILVTGLKSKVPDRLTIYSVQLRKS